MVTSMCFYDRKIKCNNFFHSNWDGLSKQNCKQSDIHSHANQITPRSVRLISHMKNWKYSNPESVKYQSDWLYFISKVSRCTNVQNQEEKHSNYAFIFHIMDCERSCPVFLGSHKKLCWNSWRKITFKQQMYNHFLFHPKNAIFCFFSHFENTLLIILWV